MSGWTVGVDFGGTNIKVGLVTDAGRVAATQVLSAKRFGIPSKFVAGVGETVELLARSVRVSPRALRGVCVGAPGPVDAERGLVHRLVNVPGWRDVPLGRLLRQRLRCRCLVENDVNLVALGEWRFGAGRGARQLVCLTLGTGVGGGLICHGTLYRGASGAAGELGHMVIDPHGARCGCGARGCLEAHVGTAGILRLGRSVLHQQAGGRLTPALLNDAAGRGDGAAREVWRRVGRSLGIGVANLVNALNPDRVVIGGGVANAWRWFAPMLQRTVRAQALPVAAHAVRIVRAQLGDHAGVVGAAVLIWDETQDGGRGARGVGHGRRASR